MTTPFTSNFACIVAGFAQHSAGSGSFFPADPTGVLELEARKVHVELNSIDPRTDLIEDSERARALRRLLHKNRNDPLPADDLGNHSADDDNLAPADIDAQSSRNGNHTREL
ncbi:MAG: hypothetical protein JWN40_2737 [Phycisphaerales bacterium]|nr:hypothetical protein [Phycisphaerales bacterium]